LLSARGYHRALRVARTLADLDGAEQVVASISPRLSAIAARRFAAPKPPLNYLI
jgi:predicted ATPase with chaperone activity